MKTRQGFVSNSSSTSFIVVIHPDCVPTPEQVYRFYKPIKHHAINDGTEIDDQEIIHQFLDNVRHLQKRHYMNWDEFIGDEDNYTHFINAMGDSWEIGNIETGADSENTIVNFGSEHVVNRLLKNLLGVN